MSWCILIRFHGSSEVDSWK